MTAVGRTARPRFRGLPKLRGLPPIARREALWGYLFIAPWIIGFFLFTLAPVIASLAFTFSNIALDQQEPLGFVGLRNWQTLLGDAQAWESLAVTFRFAAFWLPFIDDRAVPARRRGSTAASSRARAASGSCSSSRTWSRSSRAS